MDRRSFLALSGSTMLHRAASAVSPASSPDALPVAPLVRTQNGKVNIVMIMADQHRKDCIGAYGNRTIRTPHLDRIAREGVLFANAYSSTPSCTPARSALMTGRSPWGHGMLGYSNIATNPYPTEKAAVLAKAGYYTLSIGKNHYFPITNPHGYHHLITDEHDPYWFDTKDKSQAQPGEPRCDYESWFWSQLPDKNPYATGLGWNDQPSRPFVFPEELHATHWTGATAVRFLEQYDRSAPFFLKVSFIRPHCPYDPPERFFKMYEAADLPQATVGPWASKFEALSSEHDDRWHGKLRPDQIRNSRQGYYGNVSFVDEQIGKILEALERRNLLDNTMIVYFSDHGDMLGDQNLWRKTYAYEQSAHIPMLLRPAKTMELNAAGIQISNPVEIRDLLPTFLDAAGQDIPTDVEGKSLLQLVRDGNAGWREYIDLEHDVAYSPENHWNALTDGKWKYIFHAYDGNEQLFHLESDPVELNDLAAQPAYRAELERWRARMVQHLEVRGPQWVNEGRLMVRKKSIPHSPNFPGYATVSHS